jgi:hypothetical protein
LSIEIRNSLYENHTIVAKPRQEPEPKCRESVILQFDPLSRTQPPKEGELTNDVSDHHVIGQFSKISVFIGQFSCCQI